MSCLSFDTFLNQRSIDGLQHGIKIVTILAPFVAGIAHRLIRVELVFDLRLGYFQLAAVEVVHPDAEQFQFPLGKTAKQSAHLTIEGMLGCTLEQRGITAYPLARM